MEASDWRNAGMVLNCRALLSVVILALLTACAPRHLPVTPAYLTIHATAASCESVPISDVKSDVWAECRYTVEDAGSMHVRRIEIRKAR